VRQNDYRIEKEKIASFYESIEYYFSKERGKIEDKIDKMLINYPYRYSMCEPLIIRNIRTIGLHGMEIGVKGKPKGARILYRICEECRKNKYNLIKEQKCAFCDEMDDKTVVMFTAMPRGLEYQRLRF
jgi:hypothetical protein